MTVSWLSVAAAITSSGALLMVLTTTRRLRKAIVHSDMALALAIRQRDRLEAQNKKLWRHNKSLKRDLRTRIKQLNHLEHAYGAKREDRRT